MRKWKVEPEAPHYHHKRKSLFNWRTRSLYFLFIIILLIGLFFVPGISGRAIGDTARANSFMFIWIFVLLFVLVVIAIHKIPRHKR
ncbi:MAG: hypothetical protein JSW08_01150 [archaeon]|nr:MAG: hypothetical protein JSW08_01150 [archaeon]